MRSLAISQALLGTEEVMIVHHTDCGMLTFTGESLRGRLKRRGVDADNRVGQVGYETGDARVFVKKR